MIDLSSLSRGWPTGCRRSRPVGRRDDQVPGACVLHLSGAGGLQGREALQICYGGHALGGEHAAALQLPVFVLLQQNRTHQAGDRRIVGEDADPAGAALGFLRVR